MKMTFASCGNSPTSSRRTQPGRPPASKIRKVNELLISLYGPRPFRRQGDAVAVLLQTILSQNTSDVNSSRAFHRLRERFPSWEQMANAEAKDIEEAISCGGLGAIKSQRLKRVLRAVYDYAGSYSLNFLKKLSPQDGLDYLCSLDGVGRKTAACVLLFSLGMPVFPVDTHVNRIAQRLGWVPPRSNADKTALLLDQWVPDEIKYPLHLNLVAHGRAVCAARNHRCAECILSPFCPRVGVH
jgi:endonuclease-3